jgi:hypothetical protein
VTGREGKGKVGRWCLLGREGRWAGGARYGPYGEKEKRKEGERGWAGMWDAGRARCWAGGEIWAKRPDKVAGLKIERDRERERE